MSKLGSSFKIQAIQKKYFISKQVRLLNKCFIFKRILTGMNLEYKKKFNRSKKK